MRPETVLIAVVWCNYIPIKYIAFPQLHVCGCTLFTWNVKKSKEKHGQNKRMEDVPLLSTPEADLNYRHKALWATAVTCGLSGQRQRPAERGAKLALKHLGVYMLDLYVESKNVRTIEKKSY